MHRAPSLPRGRVCLRRQDPTVWLRRSGVVLGTIDPTSREDLALKLLHTTALLAGLLLLGLGAGPAAASLGGSRATIEADRAALKGERNVSTATGYEVHEIATPGGGKVREYLTLDGRVFAVSWKGPSIPDLRQLLGTYYDRFAQAAAAPHPGRHRALRVEQPGLVVQSAGRMRNFYGRAWDPQLLPQNFSTASIY